jgi:hypothetical protein
VDVVVDPANLEWTVEISNKALAPSFMIWMDSMMDKINLEGDEEVEAEGEVEVAEEVTKAIITKATTKVIIPATA